MFVKGVHSGPPEIEEERSGDRDTPTRAIILDASGRPAALPTLKSPAGLPVLDDDVLDVPTVLVTPSLPAGPGQPLSPGAPTAKLTLPLAGLPPIADFGPMSAPSAEPGTALAPPAPAVVEPAGPPASSPFKPGWQQSIDRALIRAGRYAETQSQRFKAAPQNTQIIVVIVVGTALILLLGAMLFFALR
jgi:hypothetical protein